MMDKLNNLPIIKILQIASVIVFAIGLVQIIISVPLSNFYLYGEIARTKSILVGLTSISMQLAMVIYKPLILLGLAEIIKLMKEKS